MQSGQIAPVLAIMCDLEGRISYCKPFCMQYLGKYSIKTIRKITMRQLSASTRPDCSQPVCLFIYQQTCERDILKTNKPILSPIGTNGLRGTGMKRSTLGSGGQRSRSHTAEDRFGCLADALLSTSLSQVSFLVVAFKSYAASCM